MKKTKKIYKDKRGFEYIKESYFLKGKMKIRKIYMVDAIPAEEFYEQNATSLDHFINGEYDLMENEQDYNNYGEELSELKFDLSSDEEGDLPF